ncbi:MAG: hypothetical protein ACJ71R_20165, partial [Nitrososphaeraceae archaeon]
PKIYRNLFGDESQMKLLAEMQRRTMMKIAVPMLHCAITAISLISISFIVFTYYLAPIIAYSQTEPLPANHLYMNVVNSNSSNEQQLMQQPQSKVIEASGHFANNQIENDSVSWIQGGLWHIAVYNSSSFSSSSNSTTGAKAIFSGNFTMVKPDGTETHEHSVSDFTSNNVIIAAGDMIITGIGNIYENAALKYRQVPITVHLMGKEHVLGLIIDAVKTDRHFVSSHEMFGTLIKGTGLERIEKTLISSSPQQQQKSNNKGMNMNGMTT